MRLFLCIFLGSLASSVAWGQAPLERSPVNPCSVFWSGQGRYGLSNFRKVLRLAELGGSMTFTDTALRNAGDGLSVAMLKIVDQKDLLNPVFIRGYLRLARTAFSTPQFIACAPDKHPDVTLFLLDYLREKVSDKDLQNQIESTKQYVLDQTEGVTPAADLPKQSPPSTQAASQ